MDKGKGRRLLRIYWYDGSSSGRLSMEQASVANTDDIKLRLGQINSAGQQKGVDSLIVTDLIELARNRAVSDAVLLSGDEDVRIGVQIAQSFGVRVHLLGIDAGNNSQALQLKQEADTTSVWTKADVEKFLTVKTALQPLPTPDAASGANLDKVAVELADSLETEQVREFADYRKTNTGVPSEFDGRLLARARDAIGRDLNASERKSIRAKFVEAVKARQPELFS